MSTHCKPTVVEASQDVAELVVSREVRARGAEQLGPALHLASEGQAVLAQADGDQLACRVAAGAQDAAEPVQLVLPAWEVGWDHVLWEDLVIVHLSLSVDSPHIPPLLVFGRRLRGHGPTVREVLFNGLGMVASPFGELRHVAGLVAGLRVGLHNLAGVVEYLGARLVVLLHQVQEFLAERCLRRSLVHPPSDP